MNRFPFSLKVSGILFPLFLVFSTVFSPSALASAPRQAACGEACACEGYTPEQVWEEYKQRVIQDNYYYYDYPSKCSEKYGNWVEPGSEPLEDILRKIGYFLEEMQGACQKCRGEAAPPPPTATNTPPPAAPQELKPAAPQNTPTPASTPTPTPELPFPEVLVEFEKAPDGRPYRGITADGQATLDIYITNRDETRAVQVVITEFIGALRASEGQLTGEFVGPGGARLGREGVEVAPASRTTIRYRPPESDSGGLLNGGAMIQIRGASGPRNAPATPAGLLFNISCQGFSGSQESKLDFVVLRPPVQMVHGYLGNESTWQYLSGYLAGQQFDAVPGTYDPSAGESTIQTMAGILGDDIDKLLKSYSEQGIKASRVDLVTHSMGGLISRHFLDANPEDKVRKLIMLATPNHGVDDWQRATRFLASTAALGKHFIAGHQLNSDNLFFAEVNTGEEDLLHLNPDVEYANIIGRASCGHLCPHDAVVEIASAHLNGAEEFIFDKTIHSAALGWIPGSTSDLPFIGPQFGKDDISITDSKPVADKVLELLTHPIPPAAPDSQWSLVLQDGQGKVYISPRNSEQQDAVASYPVKLPLQYRVRTGFDGLATVVFYLDGEERKRVELASASEIEFGVASPETLNAIVRNGSGRFVTALSPGGEREECDFHAMVFFEGDPPTPHPMVEVRDDGTDFVVRAAEPITIAVLDGSVLMNTYGLDGLPVTAGQKVTKNPDQAIFVNMDGSTGQAAIADAWWKNEFFQRSYTRPEWIAPPQNPAAPAQNPPVENPDITSGDRFPSVLLMGCSLTFGALVVLLFVIFVATRKGKPPAGVPAQKGKGLFGVSGLRLTGILAAGGLACLGLAAGFIWWLGAAPTSTSVQPALPAAETAGAALPPQPIDAPPAPVPLDQLPPADQPSAQPLPAGELSGQGPRVLIATEDGLWLINENGSGLTHLVADPFLSPRDLRAAVSPDGSRIAFITASDAGSPRDPTLFVLSLPDGNLQTFVELTSPETRPAPDAVFCDPELEAARAPTIGDGLAWSPDSAKLAFSASLEGESADVYVLSFAENQVSRVSDEPGHAYDLHWAPEEDKVLYFTAACFGSGAGFETGGVYLADADKGGQKLVYTPNPESYGEVFVSWLFSDRSKFLAASTSGCPYRDMRLVDMNSGQNDMLFEGCFEDYALGPTTTLAVLASRDLSDRPGVYLYTEPQYPFEPVYSPLENGREIEFDPGAMLFLALSHEEGSTSVASFDLEGQPAWYQARGGLPAFSRDGEFWLWEEGGRAFLGGKTLPEPLLAVDEPLLQPIWYEYLGGAEIRQQALFAGGGTAGTLYLLVPGEDARAAGEGIRPITAPVLIFP